MRKTLRNVITVGALGLAGLLPGCSDVKSDFARIEFYLSGSYKVGAGINGLGRYVTLSDTSDNSNYMNAPLLSARDMRERDSNKPDGRFDEINFDNIPKGHPFEKYANLDSLEALWQRSGLDKPRIEIKEKK